MSRWGDQEGFLDEVIYEVSFLESWACCITCFAYESCLHIPILLRLLELGIKEYDICRGCVWLVETVHHENFSRKKVHTGDRDDQEFQEHGH